VETLNIPSELYASQNARVIEVLVAEGQGVEWGQPLLTLEPLEK
jgi:biotin carboxyl carrier protein